MQQTDSRKLQTQNDYSVISNVYTADFGNDREHFQHIDEALALLKGAPVVDLGAGPGVVIDYLLENDIKNITSVDITSEFCQQIKQKHGDEVEVVCEDMVEYVAKLKPLSVGGYIANYSIIHIPDEEIDSLFANIQRTLVPDGFFLISCHMGTFKGMEQEPYQQQEDVRVQSNERLELYMNYFTQEELNRRIHKSGLKIINSKIYQTSRQSGEINVPKIWVLAVKSK